MSAGQEPNDTLPRRDWILLPLVVLSVTGLFLGGSEGVASIMFAEEGQYTCGTPDPNGLPLAKPNCVSYFKNAEGPMVEYRFNECGFRSSKPCGPKPDGTARVVLIGTSITLGLYVPTEETFAARTERALNQICSQPVEVQNMGAFTDMPHQPGIAGKALEFSPDVIVLTVAPFDLEGFEDAQKPAAPESQTGLTRIKAGWDEFKLKLRGTSLVLAAAHFMLLDEQMLYQTFLSSGASREVMSVPPTAAGQRKYAHFAATIDNVVARLKGSGVPLVVMAVPNRIAAAMASNHARLEGTDAYRFGRDISEIATQRGAIPLDATAEFAGSPGAEKLFYPVDNHPNRDGHAMIARALVHGLTDGSIPQLAAGHR